MGKTLLIVESPAKSKTIKKYLGSNYTVRATMGHIRDLPKSSMGVDFDNDFEPSYLTIRGKGDVMKALKKDVKASDKVILATDPDREGEAISWHIMQALGLSDKTTSRVVFNEITKDAVKAAIKHPRSIDYDLVDAQQARRLLDRIVGYSISPLLWRKVKKGLSAGRVQSVATKLICDREDEIIAFEPKEYWSIEAGLTNPPAKKKFVAKFYGDKKGKIVPETEKQTTDIINALKGAEYKVTEVKKTSKKRQPMPPFITSTLQQEAANKFGYTSTRTMMIAQQLYEGVEIKGMGAVGLITYMRTDSVRIADEAIAAARQYIGSRWGSEYLPSSPRVFKNKKNAQDAHEAIRPSLPDLIPDNIKESLSSEQFKIYKLIWDRFIASQMAPADIDVTSVTVSAADYIFKASGSSVNFPGFTTVYEETSENNEKSQPLPPLNENDVLSLKELTPKQHFTQPPARYTEASLIKTLEELGIGRPSTYAPTVSTIVARKYVLKDKRQLYPTELGIAVNELMKENFAQIVDVEFTANMETKLDEVEEGKLEWKKILRDFYGPFKKELEEADKKIEHVQLTLEESDVTCELCGRKMVYRDGRYGKFLACPGFPSCRNTKPIIEEIGVNCPKCGGSLVIRRSRKGIRYFGCINSPECDFMSWDEPTNEKCPICGSMLLNRSIKGRILKNNKVCLNKDCEYNKQKSSKKKADENE
ncbi:MAG: type I DNA topoisomerase [Ruminococcaceae bacterium]|nr:type I DNA topoisomerase [Oscillospiraceae bacterium]